MEQNFYYSSEPISNRQLMLLNALIGLVIVLCGVFLFLTFAAQGTIQFNQLPSDATVSINGHRVVDSTVHLRAGNYQVAITSPRTTPFHDTLHVSLWHSLNYQPRLKSRNPDAIASSTIGAANGTATAPQLQQAQWFDDNTWLAGRLKASGNALALHYDSSHKQWSVGFYQAPGYPSDSTNLPADVAAYVDQVGSAQ
jgi:hypothetical protein